MEGIGEWMCLRNNFPPGATAGVLGRGETMSSQRGKIVGKKEVGMSLYVGVGRRGVSGKYVPQGARAGT